MNLKISAELFLTERYDVLLTMYLDKIFDMIDKSSEHKKLFIVYFVKIALFIRNPRKGRGEKKIFHDIVHYTWNRNEKIGKILVDLTPEFGYFSCRKMVSERTFITS